MPQCFIAIPFDGSGTGLYDRLFKEEIRPALERVGFEVKIASDSYVARPIFDEIRELIKASDILFADISTNNPNVFAEVGIALGMDKPVVYSFDHDVIDRPPFDIQHFRGVPYRRTSRTYLDKFQKDIEKAITDTLAFFMEKQADQEFEKGQIKTEPEKRLRIIKMLTFDKLFEPLDPNDGVPEGELIDYLLAVKTLNVRRAEISSAMQSLLKEKWVERKEVLGDYGEAYRQLNLTESAVDWVLKNPKFHDDVRDLLAKGSR